jgi:hypothetical protein
MAFTFSNGSCRIFLNGNLTGLGDCYAPNDVGRTHCFVGGSNWNDSNLCAHIDELRVYNRSLNESEINKLVLFKPAGIESSSFLGNACTTAVTSQTSIFESSTKTGPIFISQQTTGQYSILNTNFDFSQLSSSQIIHTLNSSIDLSGCIENCSDNGLCKFDSLKNKFFCSCFSEYMSGYACQIDKRPCSSNPCLNNATCVDYSNVHDHNISALIDIYSFRFYCLCNEYYKGSFCESKIDVCQNETCSNNGNCFDSNNMPKCKCFNMYNGEKCEFESSELKTVKTVISMASVLAILMIILSYGFFVLMDISKFYWKIDTKIRSNKKKKQLVAKKFKRKKIFKINDKYLVINNKYFLNINSQNFKNH